jgi:hypothetical protein
MKNWLREGCEVVIGTEGCMIHPWQLRLLSMMLLIMKFKMKLMVGRPLKLVHSQPFEPTVTCLNTLSSAATANVVQPAERGPSFKTPTIGNTPRLIRTQVMIVYCSVLFRAWKSRQQQISTAGAEEIKILGQQEHWSNAQYRLPAALLSKIRYMTCSSLLHGVSLLQGHHITINQSPCYTHVTHALSHCQLTANRQQSPTRVHAGTRIASTLKSIKRQQQQQHCRYLSCSSYC